MEKSTRLAEIRAQLHDTSQSVRKGKQLLGTLSESMANPVRPPYPALPPLTAAPLWRGCQLTRSSIMKTRNLQRHFYLEDVALCADAFFCGSV